MENIFNPYDWVSLHFQKNINEILQLGCFSFSEASFLNDKSNTLLTVEDRPEILSSLREEKQGLTFSSNLLSLDIIKTDLRFDLAWSHNSFEKYSYSEVKYILSHINLLLKPKGIIYISIPEDHPSTPSLIQIVHHLGLWHADTYFEPSTNLNHFLFLKNYF